MKEITYEEWIKNPTPRMMWVWDDDEKDKVQRKVVYVIKGGSCCYPVRVTMNDDTDYEAYKHCAEIEKQRRMTPTEIAELERKNAELDCQVNRNKYCYSCANATDRCFRNEIGCPCEKYKSYKDENAKLQEKLKPENCLKLLAKKGYVKFTSDKINKAKEIIKNLLFFLNKFYSEDCPVCMDEAEQFLKDSIE